jgi:hypothetical protein
LSCEASLCYRADTFFASAQRATSPKLSGGLGIYCTCVLGGGEDATMNDPFVCVGPKNTVFSCIEPRDSATVLGGSQRVTKKM